MKVLSHSGSLRSLTGKDKGYFIFFHTTQAFLRFIDAQVLSTILGETGKYTAPLSMARDFFRPEKGLHRTQYNSAGTQP
jgi:hypothetical protein